MSVSDTGPQSWWTSRVVWVRIFSVTLILVGVGRYLDDFAPDQLALPLAKLSVDPSLPASKTLPIRSGSLAGRNLLLITLDTARPDRLGHYGNLHIATPNLDRLASRNSVFTRAHATTSITLPSHASILTGRYPHRHGVRTNGLPRLSAEETTLAELLSEHGYETAAFVSSFIVDKKFGLAQGFGRYDDRTLGEAAVFGYDERIADATTDRALSWLRRPRDRPFFIWVHYYDPHATYAPPAEFEESAANPYDGELAFLDREIGRLLAGVDAASREDALVVVTADHGEGFGEHGEQSHGFLLQQATLKIPLLIGTTGGLATPVRIDELVSQVDLMPTVLSLLGLPLPTGLDGIDLTEAPDRDRVILAESHYGHATYGWARLAAIYQKEFKYVDGPNPELYDLIADPTEQNNLFAKNAEMASVLRQRLFELRGPEADTLTSPAHALDRRSIERLEALGYVVPARQAKANNRSGPDPKSMLPALTRMLVLSTGMERAGEAPAWTRPVLLALGRALPRNESELLAALEEMAALEPDFAPVHKLLAEIYQESGRGRAAAASMSRFEALRGAASTAADENL